MDKKIDGWMKTAFSQLISRNKKLDHIFFINLTTSSLMKPM